MSGEEIKREVLDKISAGQGWSWAGKARVKIGHITIHVRYCSADGKQSPHYKFNVNPNSLRADYELWICGSPEVWYLVPIDVINRMYSDPAAYPDYRHPDIRVVSLNKSTNSVTYAAGGRSAELSEFLGRTLPRAA
jgi:hypothetical protein